MSTEQQHNLMQELIVNVASIVNTKGLDAGAESLEGFGFDAERAKILACVCGDMQMVQMIDLVIDAGISDKKDEEMRNVYMSRLERIGQAVGIH